jgi:hypothetical protein
VSRWANGCNPLGIKSHVCVEWAKIMSEQDL